MLTEPMREAAREIVATVAPRIEKRPICVGAFIRNERVAVGETRAPGRESAPRVELAALEPQRKSIGQRLAQLDMDNSESAEVAVLRRKRAVDDRDFLDQLRA